MNDGRLGTRRSFDAASPRRRVAAPVGLPLLLAFARGSALLAAGCSAYGYDPEAATRRHEQTPETAGTITNERTKAVYRTILEAVEGAAPGDALDLAPGTHTVNETITVSKPLRLRGAGWTRTRIELRYDAVLRVRGVPEGEVRGVSIVRVHRQAPFAGDVLLLEDCSATVAECYLAGAGEDLAFPHFAGLHVGGDCRGSSIERNVIAGNQVGIYLDTGSACGRIVSNTVVGNSRAVFDRRVYDQAETAGIVEFAENIVAYNLEAGEWYEEKADLRKTNGVYGNGGPAPRGPFHEAAPYFAAPGSLDFRLRPTSALAKAGRSGGALGAVGTEGAAAAAAPPPRRAASPEPAPREPATSGRPK
ncbi:MAG: hypothetical protein L0216_12435 [Planctomycetales bacterium]|nr:hypothetical protein [Planctomycetales bacterium]